MATKLVIDYYSDVLCVWAWIAQRRVDELIEQFGDQIELRYHYVDIFGSVEDKMSTQWADRGGMEGFAKHVHSAAADFEEAPVNSKVWYDVQPSTSANAHLVLKAVELSHGKEKSVSCALQIRQAFFIEGVDISNIQVLKGLLGKSGISASNIDNQINNGTALAALMSDYQQAKQNGIKGSPSYVMDGGRQTLYGNVGYRVLHANIEELLRHPADEASWC